MAPGRELCGSWPLSASLLVVARVGKHVGLVAVALVVVFGCFGASICVIGQVGTVPCIEVVGAVTANNQIALLTKVNNFVVTT